MGEKGEGSGGDGGGKWGEWGRELGMWYPPLSTPSDLVRLDAGVRYCYKGTPSRLLTILNIMVSWAF